MLPAVVNDLVISERGVVLRRQLRDAGLAHSTICRQARRGDWQQYNRYVLIAGWAPDDFETQARAAMLSQPGLPATGFAALLKYPNSPLRSLQQAADVPWLVADRPGAGMWRPVRHPGANPVEREGRLVLLEEDVLIDLVRLLPFDRAMDAVWIALQQGVSTPERLQTKSQPLLALAGRAQLQQILQIISGGAKSSGEERMIRIVEASGLRGIPDHPVVVGQRRFRLDYAFPQVRLGVEFDGYRFHSGPRASRRDKQRHNILSNAGWGMRYFTWHDVVEAPDDVVAQVTQALRQREAELPAAS